MPSRIPPGAAAGAPRQRRAARKGRRASANQTDQAGLPRREADRPAQGEFSRRGQKRPLGCTRQNRKKLAPGDSLHSTLVAPQAQGSLVHPGRAAVTLLFGKLKGPPKGAAPRLSKRWLAPLFRGFHSSLAPMARPGSYAGKPLLRKAFYGFAVHPPGGLLLSLRDNSPCAAKSDESLKGPQPSIR